MSETTFGRLVFEPRLTDDPRTTPARTPENEAAQSPSLMLLVLLASAGIVIYAVFLLNPGNRGDWLPFLLVIGAEAILVGQALLSMWTILSSGHNPRGFAFHHAQDGLYDVADIMRQRIDDTPQRWRMYLRDRPVTVDVFITTYGEDLDTIRRTVTAAVAMQGEHLTWVLDDGRSDAVRELTAELGARYVRRLTSNGVKAGNVNHALSLTRGELFVILDADFVPLPTFLHETVPFFASDDVAFVQTPQTYGNLHNLISRGAGYMQSVFYRFIQPGRNRFNAAFCVGTNVIFRRAAIDQIGGMYSDSKSEDVWTSIHLHEQGWRSIYIPTTLAIGDTPETIEAYTKQQLRWATGGFEILFTHNPLSRKRRLTLDQRLQYLVTATHYLGGITPLAWILFYAGFYGMQILVAFYTLGSFRWEVLMLATVSFPIYWRALVNAAFHREQKVKATSPFSFIMPQVLFFAFLLLTSVVGAWKDLSHGSLSLALIWNITNTVILGAFVLTAAREGRRTKRAAAVGRRAVVRPRRSTAPRQPAFAGAPGGAA